MWNKTGREVLGRLKSISKQHSKDVNHTRSVLLSVFCKYKHSPRTSSSLLGVHRKTVAKCVGLVVIVFFTPSQPWQLYQGDTFSSSRAIVKKHKKAEAEATTFLESSVYALSEKRLASNVGLEEDRERSCSPDQTHKDLYEDFKNSEAMTTPISFSHFTKCRPAQVRLM